MNIVRLIAIHRVLLIVAVSPGGLLVAVVLSEVGLVSVAFVFVEAWALEPCAEEPLIRLFSEPTHLTLYWVFFSFPR